MNKLGLLYGILAIGLAVSNAQTVQSTEAAQNNAETIAMPVTQSSEVTFTAVDGETVYADLHLSNQNENQPFIILFHQAGANGRAEYANIIPKLTTKGYSLLVVDQRSGGERFGGENRTVKARGEKTDYCAAYPDMEAALTYAKIKSNGSIFAWGSSYSAAMVLKLASEHADDLAGVLSFSPASGSSMGACSAKLFTAAVSIPTIAFRPDEEIAFVGAEEQALFEQSGHTYYVAKDGVHGSSMLDPSRTKGRAKGDVEPTWEVVWAFLGKHK